MNCRDINRWYCAILYEDDPNYNTYIKNITELYNMVTWIRHDKDINEDGTPKKPHVHILFNVGENARYRKSISKEIGLAENYIAGCNKKNMLKYLIHFGKEEKTQYNIEEVHGELKEELKRIIEREMKNTNERLRDLIEEVKKGKILSIGKLIEYGLDNDIMDDIKKNQLILCKLIDEEKNFIKNKA